MELERGDRVKCKYGNGVVKGFYKNMDGETCITIHIDGDPENFLRCARYIDVMPIIW